MFSKIFSRNQTKKKMKWFWQLLIKVKVIVQKFFKNIRISSVN